MTEDTAAHGVIIRARRTMWGVLAIAAALLIVAAAVFYSAATRPKPFAPLGPYPEQQVLEPETRTGIPTVSLSDPVVHVRGTKCADRFDGQITGTVVWQSLNPRGVSIKTGEGTRSATGGCISFSYRNDIPEGVISVMTRQINDGLHPKWRIVGTETPTSETRGIGVPLTWATEPFRVTQ